MLKSSTTQTSPTASCTPCWWLSLRLATQEERLIRTRPSKTALTTSCPNFKSLTKKTRPWTKSTRTADTTPKTRESTSPTWWSNRKSSRWTNWLNASAATWKTFQTWSKDSSACPPTSKSFKKWSSTGSSLSPGKHSLPSPTRNWHHGSTSSSNASTSITTGLKTANLLSLGSRVSKSHSRTWLLCHNSSAKRTSMNLINWPLTLKWPSSPMLIKSPVNLRMAGISADCSSRVQDSTWIQWCLINNSLRCSFKTCRFY